jgi:two-component system response regulator HydG
MSSGPFIHPADLPSNIKGNSPSFTGSNDSSDDSMVIPIADLERKAILSTVARLNGDKMRAARMLGIGKTTLYRKLKEYAGQLNPAAEPVLRA